MVFANISPPPSSAFEMRCRRIELKDVSFLMLLVTCAALAACSDDGATAPCLAEAYPISASLDPGRTNTGLSEGPYALCGDRRGARPQ